jgi:nucleotide-binding universal stress UspA family protein
MSGTITVGFDRSEGSYSAVRWAAAEAVRRHSGLRVVNAYPMMTMTEVASVWIPPETATAPAVDDDEELVLLRDGLRKRHPELDVDVDLVPGPAWAVITDDRHPSEVIVVGAGSHRGVAAFWLGSTPRAVIRHAMCPVAVVRGDHTVAGRVVVGIDGSAGADRALDWAIAEADLHRTPLTVVHIWEYPYAPIGAIGSQPHDIMQVDAACVLDAAVERARTTCAGSVDSELLEGSAAYLLPAVASDGDLLVLGSSGRGAVRSSLLGSTVNRVVEQSEVSVVVVPTAAPGS